MLRTSITQIRAAVYADPKLDLRRSMEEATFQFHLNDQPDRLRPSARAGVLVRDPVIGMDARADRRAIAIHLHERIGEEEAGQLGELLQIREVRISAKPVR